MIIDMHLLLTSKSRRLQSSVSGSSNSVVVVYDVQADFVVCAIELVVVRNEELQVEDRAVTSLSARGQHETIELCCA